VQVRAAAAERANFHHEVVFVGLHVHVQHAALLCLLQAAQKQLGGAH
jgi:hypothetical protein